MRLLNAKTRRLESFLSSPSYAIVSHRWGSELEEVLFTDIISGDESRAERKGKGYDKVLGCCSQALEEDIFHVWLDTCCIDKSNNTELSEALNSMFDWYRNSKVCYAYLHDVEDLSDLLKSEWFGRGWTLQELIAPRVLKFFAKDWSFLGTREDLVDQIAERTGINPEALQTGEISPKINIAQVMYWAAGRETMRVEDRAYSLLGFLGVHMIASYGIKQEAFAELQRKLIDSKRADQTLFAWYHIAPQDVVMVDDTAVPRINPSPSCATNNPAPTATLALPRAIDPFPSYALPSNHRHPASLAHDQITFPLNSTGLLAPSPSQYLKAHEIPELDFLKNVVDKIRDRDAHHAYRHHFSISNNLVHITLPIKHLDSKRCKAVLRCSFDPPSANRIQRPVIIYLEAIPLGQYVRTHIPVSREIPDEKNASTDGVPGSLERLRDEEEDLAGYVLQDISVVGHHGEQPSALLQHRPAEDDRPFEMLIEEERIKRQPKHLPTVKTTNVIVFGEPGVGAASVVNQILGANVLSDIDRSPMHTITVDGTLDSKPIRIFYITGLKDHYLHIRDYPICIRNMYRLVHEAGGIHLLMFCIVGSKVTASVMCNYRLIHDFVCGGQVPMVLVVTGLGGQERMDDWWTRHRNDDELKTMPILGHACVTVFPGDTPAHQEKFKESTRAIRGLIGDLFDSGGYVRTDVVEWFVEMGRKARKIVPVSQRGGLTQNEVEKILKECCDLGGSLRLPDAKALAERFLMDDNEMEL